MGTWSGEPFGNDAAADWAWELDDAESWDIVFEALQVVLDEDPATLDADTAGVAIAAAEVVAHHLGRPTQSDAYTDNVSNFVGRAHERPADLVAVALRALDIATAAEGELAELWAEDDAGDWHSANERLREALSVTGQLS